MNVGMIGKIVIGRIGRYLGIKLKNIIASDYENSTNSYSAYIKNLQCLQTETIQSRKIFSVAISEYKVEGDESL